MKLDLRNRAAPGEDAAFTRAHAVAVAAARPAPQRRRRRLRAFAPIAASLVLAVLILSPAGAGVRTWVREAVTDPQPARAVGLPGGGRLVTTGRAGVFVRTAQGPRRIFGDAGEAAWSPRGLFLAVTRGVELIAISPTGERRWSLHHRHRILDPRWAPSGLLVAYRSGGRLWVVEGDGDHDRVLGRAAVAPAWRPRSSQVATATARALLVRDANSGRIVARHRLASAPLQLSWSADGERLLAVFADRIELFNQLGARLRVSHTPAGARNVAGSFDRAGRGWTLIRTDGRTSRVLMVRGEQALKVIAFDGRATELARSPAGDWLALRVGRQLWLVRPGFHAGLRGVRTLPAHGRLMDWAPPLP